MQFYQLFLGELPQEMSAFKIFKTANFPGAHSLEECERRCTMDDNCSTVNWEWVQMQCLLLLAEAVPTWPETRKTKCPQADLLHMGDMSSYSKFCKNVWCAFVNNNEIAAPFH